MAEDDDQPAALGAAVRSGWRGLGGASRTMLIALAMSATVALILGVSIPRRVEHHLIEGEIWSLSRIAQSMAAAGMIPPDGNDPLHLAALDEAVKLDLLGADTVRVKIWAPDGTITYSDQGELIGQKFPLSESRANAFRGQPQAGVPNLALPENAHERELAPLREIYVPVKGDTGSVVAVFEVYHLAEPIETTVRNIERYVWASITIGLGLLAVFIAILIIANGRAITRRRRLTERLFGDLVRSQGEERTRIIGALHDDIGQYLYRIHYGLEDLRSRVDGDPAISGDVEHLGALVGHVDQVLRAELRLLRFGTGEELSLGPALDELAEVTEMESDLSVSVDVGAGCDLSPTSRVALFRAAGEALTNVRKHASATEVTVRVQRQGKDVRLDVIDDGVGIIGDEGLGLTTTREHLEAIGGGLWLKANRTQGARFVAWVPAEECEVAR